MNIFQPGDSVSWFIKEGGQQTALVENVINENTVTIVGWDGTRSKMAVGSLRPVNDSRMNRIRNLDKTNPSEGEKERAAYLADYVARAEAVAASIQGSRDVARTNKPTRVVMGEANPLAAKIVAAVLKTDSPIGKSDIISTIGEKVSAGAWISAIADALATEKIVKEGEKRGTKYRPAGE